MYLKSYDPEVFCYHLYIHRIAVLDCPRERGGHHSTLDPVWRVLLGCAILCVMENFLPKMPCWIMQGLEQRFPGVPSGSVICQCSNPSMPWFSHVLILISPPPKSSSFSSFTLFMEILYWYLSFKMCIVTQPREEVRSCRHILLSEFCLGGGSTLTYFNTFLFSVPSFKNIVVILDI